MVQQNMGRIKGERYVDEQNEGLLVDAVNFLPYADGKEVLDFYHALIHDPRTRPQDFALLACNDRFFLTTFIMGRRDMLHPWIYDRCREVEHDPDGYLDLWAREHYKSTIITFAGVIQEIFIDPEITVSIFSVTQKIARKFMHQIKFELESNQLMIDCFSDVLWDKPKKESPRWSLDGLTVKRQTNPK